MEAVESLHETVSDVSPVKPASRSGSRKGGILILLGILVAGVLVWRWDEIMLAVHGHKPPVSAQREVSEPATPREQMQLSAGRTDELVVPDSVSRILGVKLASVSAGVPPRPLQLTGRLFIDSTRVARVHSRFSGEIISLGSRDVKTGHGTEKRPLRYGDEVQRDEVLAVIWSKEIGEKKSQLIDSISRLRLNQSVIERLEKLEKGVVSERMIHEAERNYEADQIAVALAERTLRSWRIPEEEISQVRLEAERLHARNMESNPELERKWAQVEIRAPFSGVLLEISAAPGVIVETTEELFKIADMKTLSVIAHVYEEDLPLLERLSPQQRKWIVEVNGASEGVRLHGEFGLIGEVIDPMQHTASIIGWVPNDDRKLRIGQFITATIPLPAQADEVSIPSTALLEDGREQFVFIAADSSGVRLRKRIVEVTSRGENFIGVRIHKESDEGTEKGLGSGDRVVTAGSVELASGLTNLLVQSRNAGSTREGAGPPKADP